MAGAFDSGEMLRLEMQWLICVEEQALDGPEIYRTVDSDPFIKSQLASTQLNLEPHAVHIWSRNISELRETKHT